MVGRVDVPMPWSLRRDFRGGWKSSEDQPGMVLFRYDVSTCFKEFLRVLICGPLQVDQWVSGSEWTHGDWTHIMFDLITPDPAAG